ncbi:hypothetical protein BDR26DRAFT_865460 [Obelidium mucronatum]|nr:hypothetical protein BDR26DRAFT_865460 [Obelidium mucronatum]
MNSKEQEANGYYATAASSSSSSPPTLPAYRPAPPPSYGNSGPPFPPPPAGAPPPSIVNSQEARLQAFRNIVERHGISNFMAVKMRRLEAYDIVIIADDSLSMQLKSTVSLTESDPFARTPTRWQELKETVSIVAEIGAVLDEDGVDVYFLNRPPVRGIRGPSNELNAAFVEPPLGCTPIARVLRQVLSEKGLGVGDHSKKLLVLIATDGEPTTDNGKPDREGLYNVLKNERGSNPHDGSVVVVFLACTDDLNQVGYLNELDKKIACVDVVDDYYSERREILAIQGDQFPFSKGDWVCKMLLGGIDPEIDALDERRIKNSAPAAARMYTTGPSYSSNSLSAPGPQLGRRLSHHSIRSSSEKNDCIIQ